MVELTRSRVEPKSWALRALEKLERNAMKIARCVLRRPKGGNTRGLSDNLEAFILLNAQNGLDAYPKVLCEWLDFFARAHTKTVADIAAGNYSEPVKQAYELIKDLPPDLEKQYQESLFEREQISHYIQGTRELALAEGDRKVAQVKAEAEAREAQLRSEVSQLRADKHRTAQSLLQRGLALDEIAIITGLSMAELETLKQG